MELNDVLLVAPVFEVINEAFPLLQRKSDLTLADRLGGGWH